MKSWSTIIKIVVALAAVAGAIYVAATYGDRIVAWAKKMLNSRPTFRRFDCDCDFEADAVAEQADFEG